jgi:rhodanese-related sulfurtransferase
MECTVDTALDTPVSISPAALACLQGHADAPLLLDVRRPAPFEAGGRLLAGAIRCTPQDVAAFARREAPRRVVAYCVYGHGVGCEAAAALAREGWDAAWLAGGIEGGEDGADAAADVARWRATPPLTIRKRPDLGVTGERPSRWITRSRPKVDRVACPWLIRRFIDSRAQFFYVPEAEVFGQAAALGAVPFDIEGAPITHHRERCSFDALLEAFDLRSPALDQLATIVRGADTDRASIAAPAAGLLALSLGLSRLHADDGALLAAAMPMYDALYAWFRAGQDERHGWRAHAVAA